MDELKEYNNIESAKMPEINIEDLQKARSLNRDITVLLKNIRQDLETRNYLDKDGNVNPSRVLTKGNARDLQRFSEKHSNLIMEIADNGAMRIHKRIQKYGDIDNPNVKLKTTIVHDQKAEFADDDRVLGIPYAQAMAGDRVYIINGKVFTGWSLYFSLSSIKSPEDYAKNVDLTYNIPYLHGSMLLKAQLGLGVGFDVNYGSEELEVPEEKLIRKYLFKKLKINTQKLVKTGFHLYLYGNAYWALRKDLNKLADKITILQPERLKIFLDPMTTKILFYIYLPPIIGGTTIASYPSDGKYNPNILTGVTLSYPTPVVMHTDDVIHFKINDFTEYPFGFSDVKTCIDAATARMDINILAPIIFKKYTKPMIHWILKSEGLGPNQIKSKQDEMTSALEQMEPGSDPVTTDLWTTEVIDVTGNKNDIFNLASDMDTQIFAATGAPETYFKPKGSTDRMISEQDKTFISRMKIPQSIIAEGIEEQLIKPRIDYEIKCREEVEKFMGKEDKVDQYLKEKDSFMAKEPKYPAVEWNEIFKQDETQAIANAIALLNSGIIDPARAATKVGEKPIAEQRNEDTNKVGIKDPLGNSKIDPFAAYKISDPNQGLFAPDFQQQNIMNQGMNNQRANMEKLRGSLNVTGKKDESNRNIHDVKDPTYLGGSRHSQENLTGQRKDGAETADNFPIKFEDFFSASKPGNYTIFYYTKNNDLFIEMPTESQVFTTKVSMDELKNRLVGKFSGTDDQMIKMFMKMNFHDKQCYLKNE